MRVRHQLERFENGVGGSVAERLLELIDEQLDPYHHLRIACAAGLVR